MIFLHTRCFWNLYIKRQSERDRDRDKVNLFFGLYLSSPCLHVHVVKQKDLELYACELKIDVMYFNETEILREEAISL